MITELSHTEACKRLAELWDRVLEERASIRLTRHRAEPVVLVAADEYDGLLTTVHLLRSPANAARLSAVLEEARARTGAARLLDAHWTASKCARGKGGRGSKGA